jgi:hypothetical protein
VASSVDRRYACAVPVSQTDLLIDELMPMLIHGGIVDIATMERLIRRCEDMGDKMGGSHGEAYSDLAHRVKVWLIQSSDD